jgi:hypothetical protein
MSLMLKQRKEPAMTCMHHLDFSIIIPPPKLCPGANGPCGDALR